MSALLAKRGPLPAVAIAAAFAAASPPAEAVTAPLTDTAKNLRADVAALLAKARAAGAGHAASVLDWISTAHIEVAAGTTVNGRIDAVIAAQLGHVREGVGRMETWAASASRDVVRLAGAAWTETAATMRLVRAAAAAEAHPAYDTANDALRSVAGAVEGIFEGIEARLRPAPRVLAAFTLKADTAFAPVKALQAKATIQPFFDAYSVVLQIEAATGVSLDWTGIHTALATSEADVLTAASETTDAPVTLHADLMDRLSTAVETIQALQTLLDGNRQLIALAKAELLSAVNDVTRLALRDTPTREARRVLVTRPQVEPAAAEPATAEPIDTLTFGRRINFDGKAHRLLVGER